MQVLTGGCEPLVEHMQAPSCLVSLGLKTLLALRKVVKLLVLSILDYTQSQHVDGHLFVKMRSKRGSWRCTVTLLSTLTELSARCLKPVMLTPRVLLSASWRKVPLMKVEVRNLMAVKFRPKACEPSSPVTSLLGTGLLALRRMVKAPRTHGRATQRLTNRVGNLMKLWDIEALSTDG